MTTIFSDVYRFATDRVKRRDWATAASHPEVQDMIRVVARLSIFGNDFIKTNRHLCLIWTICMPEAPPSLLLKNIAAKEGSVCAAAKSGQQFRVILASKENEHEDH
jgi:hypothetical protein